MEILTLLLLFVPLMLILWLANMADRRRPAPPIAGEADHPAEFVMQPAPVLAPPTDGPRSSAWQPAPPALPDREAPVFVEPPPAVAVPEQAWRPSVAPAARPQPDDTGTLFAGLAYALLVLMLLGMLFFGLMLQVVAAMMNGPAAAAQFADTLRASGINPTTAGGSMASAAPGLWAPALVALVLVLRPVRRLIARAIPIDPLRTVHAIALSYTMLVVANMVVTAVLLPQFATVVEQQAQQGQVAMTPAALWSQEILMAVMAVIGVGWLARRTIGRVAGRLALVVPTWRQAGIAVGLALLLVPLGVAIQLLAQALNLPMDANVEKLSNLLVGPLTRSAFGIITMGVAAALGEELLFRGALQPRFGLLFTAILFALLHSQDGLSLATLVVFIIGIVLGVLRARTNTTTTMITHAVYNSTLGLLAYLAIIK